MGEIMSVSGRMPKRKKIKPQQNVPMQPLKEPALASPRSLIAEPVADQAEEPSDVEGQPREEEESSTDGPVEEQNL